MRRRVGRAAAATCIVLLLSILVPAGAQDGEQDGPQESSQDEQAGSDGQTGTRGGRKDKSPLERYREVVRYGIDDELLSLIETLEAQGETRLNGELAGRLSETHNQQLMQTLLDFFRETEYQDSAVEELARGYIREFRNHQPQLVTSAIRYVTETIEGPAQESMNAVRSLVEQGSPQVANAAVRGLGSVAAEEDVDFLLKRLRDRRLSQSVRETIVLTLGEMGSAKAVEPLMELAGSNDTPNIMRRYAVDSLGRIGDEEAVPLLRSLLGSGDSLLRAYAVSALGRFSGEEVESELIAALRDSHVQVRIQALTAIGEQQITAALPAVQYKARNDPEQQVRTQALETLGALGTKEARETLENIMLSGSAAQPERMTAATQLIRNHLGRASGALGSLIDQEWEKRESRILRHVAKELSTQSDARAAAPFYERFLRHPSATIRVYGIRGIARNSLRRFSDEVENLSGEDNHPAVIREAERATESLR